MSIEGKIHIQLDPGSDCPVHIRSSRPGEVTRLFEGQSAEQVLRRMPMLYTLCGHAQELASRLAFTALEKHASPEPVSIESTLCEGLQEYLWRFLIDLPQRLGSDPALALFVPLRQSLVKLPSSTAEVRQQGLDELRKVLKTDLFGMSVQGWIEQTPEQLERWLESRPTLIAGQLREARQLLNNQPQPAQPMRLLPAKPDDRLLTLIGGQMAKALFMRAPQWQGGFAETGAIAYQQHHGWIRSQIGSVEEPVIIRLVARLLEIAELFICLESGGDKNQPLSGALSGSLKLADNVGLGWVRTARGLLVHRVLMSGDRVEDYRILAPTEWNFHPQGALYQGLSNWLKVAPEHLQPWVALQVLSLDPCVSYECEVKHA